MFRSRVVAERKKYIDKLMAGEYELTKANLLSTGH